MQELASSSKPYDSFRTLIYFNSRFNECEKVKRCIWQLSLSSFKQIYEMLKRYVKLPKLSDVPLIIEYPDKTFALSWWPHIIYNMKDDKLVNNEFYLRGKVGVRFHQTKL